MVPFVRKVEDQQKKAFQQVMEGLKTSGVVKSYKEQLSSKVGSHTDEPFRTIKRERKAEDLSRYMKAQYRDLVD